MMLPAANLNDSDLARWVSYHFSVINMVESIEDAALLKKFGQVEVQRTFEGVEPERLFEAIEKERARRAHLAA